MNQQSFENVGVPAEVHAAHPAGFVEMREGPLQNTTSDENGPGFGFSGPLVYAQVWATQIWRYKCQCAGGDYHQLGGPYAIIRTVSQNPNGTWKYVITKSNG